MSGKMKVNLYGIFRVQTVELYIKYSNLKYKYKYLDIKYEYRYRGFVAMVTSATISSISINRLKNKKAVLSQGNRPMLQLFFSV